MARRRLPRGTTTQRMALNPVPQTGEFIYDTTLGQWFFGNGTTAGGIALSAGGAGGGGDFHSVADTPAREGLRSPAASVGDVVFQQDTQEFYEILTITTGTITTELIPLSDIPDAPTGQAADSMTEYKLQVNVAADGTRTVVWNEDDANADAAITLEAGTGLLNGGMFTLNQAADSTITFNLDTTRVTTATTNGLYPSADFTKLAGIEAGAEVNPTTLPNPEALTITGGDAITYDGSTAQTIALPFGGYTITGTPSTALAYPRWTADDTLEWSSAPTGPFSGFTITGTPDNRNNTARWTSDNTLIWTTATDSVSAVTGLRSNTGTSQLSNIDVRNGQSTDPTIDVLSFRINAAAPGTVNSRARARAVLGPLWETLTGTDFPADGAAVPGPITTTFTTDFTWSNNEISTFPVGAIVGFGVNVGTSDITIIRIQFATEAIENAFLANAPADIPRTGEPQAENVSFAVAGSVHTGLVPDPFAGYSITGTPTTTNSVPKWTADNTLAWSTDNSGGGGSNAAVERDGQFTNSATARNEVFGIPFATEVISTGTPGFTYSDGTFTNTSGSTITLFINLNIENIRSIPSSSGGSHNAMLGVFINSTTALSRIFTTSTSSDGLSDQNLSEGTIIQVPNNQAFGIGFLNTGRDGTFSMTNGRLEIIRLS